MNPAISYLDYAVNERQQLAVWNKFFLYTNQNVVHELLFAVVVWTMAAAWSIKSSRSTYAADAPATRTRDGFARDMAEIAAAIPTTMPEVRSMIIVVAIVVATQAQCCSNQHEPEECKQSGRCRKRNKSTGICYTMVSVVFSSMNYDKCCV